MPDKVCCRAPFLATRSFALRNNLRHDPDVELFAAIVRNANKMRDRHNSTALRWEQSRTRPMNEQLLRLVPIKIPNVMGSGRTCSPAASHNQMATYQGMMTKKGVGATASKEDLDIGMSTSGEVVLTMTEALDRAGMGAFQKRIMAICGVCSAGDAMEALLLSFLLQDIKSEWNLEKGVDGTMKLTLQRARELIGMEGLLGAVVFLGVFIGSLMSGLISDKFGRWYGFVITASMTTVFGIGWFLFGPVYCPIPTSQDC